MLEFFLGAAGMLLIIAAFIAGFLFAKQTAKRESVSFTEMPDAELTQEEIEKKRKELLAENKAFNDQMGYSAAAAYRMEQTPEDGELI